MISVKTPGLDEAIRKVAAIPGATQRQGLQAMTLSTIAVRDEIRRKIQSGVAPGNAGLTSMLKGSSKPLIGITNQLWLSVTNVVISWKEGFAGVNRKSGTAGISTMDIAQTVHDGAVIPVTSKMRNMFFMLWMASEGKMDPADLRGRAKEMFEQAKGDFYPLSPNTRQIIIPGRPFLLLAAKDPKLLKRLEDIWARALRSALRGTP